MDIPPSPKKSGAVMKRWAQSPFLLLLLGGGGAAYHYLTMRQQLTEGIYARRQAIAQLSAQVVNEKLDALVDLGVSFASRPRIIQSIEEGKWEEGIGRLEAIPKKFPEINRLFLTDPSGTVKADTLASSELLEKSRAYQDWYQGVSRRWEPYVSEVYQRITKPRYNVVAIAVPIRAQAGPVIGILVLQIRLETAFRWMREIQLDPAASPYFLDQKGQLLAHPKISPEKEIAALGGFPLIQKLLRGERGVEIVPDPISQETELAAFAPVQDYGWGVVIGEPARIAFAARDRYLNAILLIYGGMLVLGGLLIRAFFRSLAERQQLKDAQRVRLIVEAAPNGMLMVDREGKITLVNSQTEKLFGYAREELLGRKIEMLFPVRFRTKEDPTYSSDFFLKPKTQPLGTGLDLFGLRKDRSEVPIEIGLNPIETTEGLFTLASIIDITERKRAEASFRRLASVVTDSNDAITVQDFEGKISAWNRGAERMYGYTESEARAMNIQETIPSAKRQEALKFMKRVLEEEEEVPSLETQRVTKDGRTLDVWLTVTRLVDEAGKPVGIATTERDITERKKAEAEIVAKNKELEILLSVTSHDLGEPLRSIENFSQMVLDEHGGRLDEESQDLLRRVVKGGARMRLLLNGILTFSQVRRITPPTEEVQGEVIVREALNGLAARIQETKAKVQVAQDLPRLCADQTWATQAVYNLVSNALKFTKPGEPPEVEIATYQPAQGDPDSEGFVVRDRGPGVAPEHAERIFELFQRAVGREVEGTGAGLAIVRTVADRHGGTTWVRPREGGGSEFIITFGKRTRGGG